MIFMAEPATALMTVCASTAAPSEYSNDCSRLMEININLHVTVCIKLHSTR